MRGCWVLGGNVLLDFLVKETRGAHLQWVGHGVVRHGADTYEAYMSPLSNTKPDRNVLKLQLFTENGKPKELQILEPASAADRFAARLNPAYTENWCTVDTLRGTSTGTPLDKNLGRLLHSIREQQERSPGDFML